MIMQISKGPVGVSLDYRSGTMLVFQNEMPAGFIPPKWAEKELAAFTKEEDYKKFLVEVDGEQKNLATLISEDEEAANAVEWFWEDMRSGV